MNRLRKWMRRILFVVLGLGVLYGLTALGLSLVARARLTTALERARQSGAPLSPGEAAPPPVPASENAAVVLEEAFALLADEPEETEVTWELLQEDPRALTETDARVFESRLEENGPALARIEQAVERPACLFRRDWSRGVDAPTPHVPDLMKASRALSCRGYLQVRAGDVDGALGTSRTLLRLGRAVRTHPAALDMLVGIAIEGVGRRIARLALSAGRPSVDAVERLLATVESSLDDAPLEAVYVFERALGNYVFERWPDDGLDVMTAEGLDEGRGFVARAATTMFDAQAIQLEHARYLGLMDRITALSTRPPLETRRAWSLLMTEAADAPWYDRLTAHAIPMYELLKNAWEAARASMDLMRIALRVELRVLGEGVVPASLDVLDLAGGTRDRLGSGSYVYRVDGDGGYLLYSVGVNGEDEGGLEVEGRRNEGDIVWRRPARAE